MKIGRRSSLILLVALLPLSGCVAVVAGGAAAGGYYVGQDERSLGEITDDAAITTKVKALLIKEESIKALDINVDTRMRVVTLHGQVNTEAEKSLAIQIARDTKGVVDVIPNLAVRPVAVREI